MQDTITIADFIRDYDVRIESTMDVDGYTRRQELTGMPEGSHHYRVTLTRSEPGKRRRRMTVDYSMGPALCRDPEADEVLMALVLDANSVHYGIEFQSFCEEFGLPFEADYDEVSPAAVRRSRMIFAACQTVAAKLDRWLPEGIEPSMIVED